jgi:hypothetical protein
MLKGNDNYSAFGFFFIVKDATADATDAPQN